MKNELDRAQSRVKANERKARPRRLIVTGGAVEAEAEADPAFAGQLRALLERRLVRDQDRALVGLASLPVQTPEPEPAVAGDESVPAWVVGWTPARLPDGSWGSRHHDPAVLPQNLVSRVVEIMTRKGDSWTTMIEYTVSRSETHVLVKDTGRPAR